MSHPLQKFQNKPDDERHRHADEQDRDRQRQSDREHAKDIAAERKDLRHERAC